MMSGPHEAAVPALQHQCPRERRPGRKRTAAQWSISAPGTSAWLAVSSPKKVMAKKKEMPSPDTVIFSDPTSRAKVNFSKAALFASDAHAKEYARNERAGVCLHAEPYAPRSLQAFVTGWKVQARREGDQRRAMRRAATALRSRGLRQTFNKLAEVAHSAREARRRMLVAANEFRGAKIRACWNSWMEAANDSRTMRGALMSLSQRKSRMAFNSWVELVNEQSRMRGALVSLVQRQSRIAWCSWTAFAADGHRTRMVMGRAAAAIMQRISRQAFNTWHGTAARLSDEREVRRRSIMALCNSGLLKAFNCWIAAANEAAEALRRMRTAANEFRGAKVRACWNTWRKSLMSAW